MSELIKLFRNSENFSTKHFKYFNVYENLLKRFRDQDIIFVEIGVLNGGSLDVWKKYFSNKSKIIGIDQNPECKKFQKDNIKIYIYTKITPFFFCSNLGSKISNCVNKYIK